MNEGAFLKAPRKNFHQKDNVDLALGYPRNSESSAFNNQKLCRMNFSGAYWLSVIVLTKMGLGSH